MNRLLPLLFLALCLAPASASGAEILRQRVLVPSPDQPQGEVRILQRGEAVVVQTLLYTKILKRVVGTICGKEEAAWPRQRPGSEDSRRYVEALRQARSEIEGRRKQGAAGEERLQALLIEFVLDGREAKIGLYEPTYGGEGGELVVRERRPIAEWSAARQYVAENMLEIVQDAFALDPASAAARLDLPAAAKVR